MAQENAISTQRADNLTSSQENGLWLCPIVNKEGLEYEYDVRSV